MSKTIICIDINGKQHEIPVDKLVWRPSAYAIVIKDNAILLSPQFGDGYDLPGGGLEFGESPEEAVIRETKEETGLDIKSPRLVGFASSLFLDLIPIPKPMQSILFYYQCDLIGGELSTAGFDEHEKEYARLAEWVPLAKLSSIKVKSSYDWRKQVAKAIKP